VAKALTSTLLRQAACVASLLACFGLQANTLGIVTSAQGAAYDELVEAVRNDLKTLPGVKIQVIGLGEDTNASRLAADTFMLITVGVQATRRFAADPNVRWPILGVMVPRVSFEALVPTPRNPRRITAIYLDQAPQRQVELIRVLLPAARAIGVVVGPTNQRDLEAIRPLAGQKGLSLITENASRDTELYPALQSVLRSSDVLLALPDPFVVNAATAQNLLLTSFRFRTPVIGYSAAYVRAGALAAAYSAPRQIGAEAAQLVRQTLRGVPLPEPRHPRSFSIAINQALAQSLNLNLPDEATVQQRVQSQETVE
jgi:putative ABC transport system substrate-binding protein